MQGACPNCGTTVDLAKDAETGETVPLELYTDSHSAAPRYRVLRIEDNHSIVERVVARASGAFQPDHRYDCSAFDAGRR